MLLQQTSYVSRKRTGIWSLSVLLLSSLACISVFSQCKWENWRPYQAVGWEQFAWPIDGATPFAQEVKSATTSWIGSMVPQYEDGRILVKVVDSNRSNRMIWVRNQASARRCLCKQTSIVSAVVVSNWWEHLSDKTLGQILITRIG